MSIVKPGLWRRFTLALGAFFSVLRFGTVSVEALWGAEGMILEEEDPEIARRRLELRNESRMTARRPRGRLPTHKVT